MAIDSSSLAQLIAEFRALNTRDAVSPDSLGFILDKLRLAIDAASISGGTAVDLQPIQNKISQLQSDLETLDGDMQVIASDLQDLESAVSGLSAKIGAVNGIAPLGADSKVPRRCLLGSDAVSRFAAIVNAQGITVSSQTPPSGSYMIEVIWLKSAMTVDSHTRYSGRFVARYSPISDIPAPLTDNADASDVSGSTETGGSGEVGGDAGGVTSDAYYAQWPGYEDFCNADGSPLNYRLYICNDSGELLDRSPSDNNALRVLSTAPLLVSGEIQIP